MTIHRGILCLFLLAVPLLSGCPDPHTESRLSNRTAAAIQVELVLDPRKYGLEPAEASTNYAKEWLEAFAQGEGVELLEIDTTRFTGRYQVAAAGSMIVHSSLGRKPYFYFNKLLVKQGDHTLSFDNEQDIAQQFQPTGDDYRYGFLIDAELLGNSE